MSPLLIGSVIGLLLTIMTLGQVSPSVMEAVISKKIEISISKEDALLQQIIRFHDLEGAFPEKVSDLIEKGYWREADDNNGFDSPFTFNVDGAKGTVTIKSSIQNPNRRAQYIRNFRHTFTPVDEGGGVVASHFVLPSACFTK